MVPEMSNISPEQIYIFLWTVGVSGKIFSETFWNLKHAQSAIFEEHRLIYWLSTSEHTKFPCRIIDHDRSHRKMF